MIRAATISFLVLLTAISFLDVAADPTGEEKNELGLFLGYTDADSDNGLSVGIDYAHNLGPRFGIGGASDLYFWYCGYQSVPRPSGVRSNRFQSGHIRSTWRGCPSTFA